MSGWFFRRRERLSRSSSMTVSKSGVSASRRVGPVSVSTRRRGSVRLGKRIGIRFRL